MRTLIRERDGYRGREAPAGNLRRFFSCSRFQSPEGGGYRETNVKL